MAIMCPSAIRGRALRITRNDDCGAPLDVSVANSRHATEAFMMFEFSPDVDTGTEIIRKNARGLIRIRDVGTDQLKGLRVRAQFCGINTVALEMLAGLIPLTDNSGDVIGGVWPREIDPKRNVQIELWSDNDEDEQCLVNGFPYVQFVFPRCRNWQLAGPVVVQDDAVDVVLSGYVEPNGNYAPSIDGEWSASAVTTIADHGLWGYQGASSLPTFSECDYLPVGS